MAADQTLALDNEGAHGYVGGAGDIPFSGPVGYSMTLEVMSAPGGSGGSSGPPPRPSTGFLYPRGDY